jgi:hypothetical protein
MVITKLE